MNTFELPNSATLPSMSSIRQFWKPREAASISARELSRMAINEGPNGMAKVDFLIAEAGKRRLRLVIAFQDFWAYTGGAQQMRAWYGSRDKSGFFFDDPRTKRDYRTWVSHVAQRVNPLTGLAYVKSVDPNHLVSSGHANVAAKPPERLSDLAIQTLDFGTWHGYPLYYKLTVQPFNDIITEFCQLGASAMKPVLLEEFGYARSNPDAAEVYATWLDTLTRDPNCAGWIVWRLVSRQDSGLYPVDEHDQFDIRNDGSPIWNVLQAATARRRPDRESSSPSEKRRETP